MLVRERRREKEKDVFPFIMWEFFLSTAQYLYLSTVILEAPTDFR